MKHIQSLLVCFVIFIYKTNAGVYECVNDKDCIDPRAKCEESICQCPRKTIYNEEGRECIELASAYGGPCKEDVQCALFRGLTKCKNGECRCADDYIYLKGECRRKKPLHDTCTEDEECFLGGIYNARKCENHICVCAPGFYIRNNTDCMPEGKAIGDMCLIDGDCKFENSFCKAGICASNSSKFAKRSVVIGEQVLDVEYEKSLSKIQSHITTSRSDGCNDNEDCPNPNSYCSPIFKSCLCQKGYFLQDARCIPELGTKCKSSSDCEIKNSECTNGKCLCKTKPFLYIMNNDNTKCIKPAMAPYFHCMQDESCYSFSSNYQCFDGPDQRSCRCKTNYSPNEFNICEEIGGLCLKDEDCGTFFPNSVCSSTKYCICKENYSFLDGVCRANIGAPCAASSDCVIENSSCTNAKKCFCDIGYAAVTPTMCRKVSDGLGKSCEYNVECSQKVAGSECVDGVCRCSEGFLKIDNGCYRIAQKMGDYCVLPQTCTNSLGNNVQCRNSQCQCGVGMKPNEDGSDCESKGITIKATSFLSMAIVALLFS